MLRRTFPSLFDCVGSFLRSLTSVQSVGVDELRLEKLLGELSHKTPGLHQLAPSEMIRASCREVDTGPLLVPKVCLTRRQTLLVHRLCEPRQPSACTTDMARASLCLEAASSRDRTSPNSLAAQIPGVVPVSTQRLASGSACESLDDLGMQFISLLASRVTLKQTASQFPHIVNKIARHRANPQALLKAIDGLLIDDRPTREGFPFVVLEELLALKEYFETPPAKFRKT